MTLKVRNAARGDKILNMTNLMPINEFKVMYINELGDPDV